MVIKQLSVFLENRIGRLAEVTKILAEVGIDIRALVISETTDFGVLRLIVNDTETAYKVLKENKFTVRLTDVVVVDMPDKSGGLAKILDVLNKSGIEIEYMYAFLGRKVGEAPAVFRFEDADKAVEVLKAYKINVLSQETINKILQQEPILSDFDTQSFEYFY